MYENRIETVKANNLEELAEKVNANKDRIVVNIRIESQVQY